MWQSLRISHLILRLSLALVFLSFGITTFFHPAWLSVGLLSSPSSEAVMYGLGIVELLIGISLVSNIFADIFASIGILLLICTTAVYGFHEVLSQNIGVLGGLLALVFWPSRSFRNY